jgi:hypothetical protein
MSFLEKVLSRRLRLHAHGKFYVPTVAGFRDISSVNIFKTKNWLPFCADGDGVQTVKPFLSLVLFQLALSRRRFHLQHGDLGDPWHHLVPPLFHASSSR